MKQDTAMVNQVGGNHYKSMAIQPVEFIIANNIGFCEGNVIKYVSRWRDKGGILDLEKARHFLFLIKENGNAIVRGRGEHRILKPSITAHKFIEANNIPELEGEIIRWVYFWSHNPHLLNIDGAIQNTDLLIDQNRYFTICQHLKKD